MIGGIFLLHLFCNMIEELIMGYFLGTHFMVTQVQCLLFYNLCSS